MHGTGFKALLLGATKGESIRTMKTIDNVNKTFERLSIETMPKYFTLLLERMKNPIEMLYFIESGVGEQTIISCISSNYLLL